MQYVSEFVFTSELFINMPVLLLDCKLFEAANMKNAVLGTLNLWNSSATHIFRVFMTFSKYNIHAKIYTNPKGTTWWILVKLTQLCHSIGIRNSGTTTHKALLPPTLATTVPRKGNHCADTPVSILIFKVNF